MTISFRLPVSLPLACVLFASSSSAQTREVARLSLPEFSSSLPEAPQVQGAGKITGKVSDVAGSGVANATVTIITVIGSGERKVVTDAQGQFSAENLPAARYKVSIAAPGFATFVTPEMYLDAGEAKALPAVELKVASANDNVQVTISQTEIADGELKLQESQRLIGILPNFYTSYLWDAAPMNKKQKFTLATHSAFDPVAFVGVGITAGIEQARNIYPEYGDGAAGYGKRYGATLGDEVIGRFLTSAVYPSIFHQDPRYFYKGTGSVGSRAFYAMSRAFVTRGDNGKAEPNYSLFLGRLSAGAIANLYHPGDRGVDQTFENAGLNVAGHAISNLLREFLFKRVTPNIPDYENGQTPQAAKAPATPPKSQP